MLQSVVSLILFAVLDNASEEIFFSRVNLNGTAQFNRPEAALLSVRNDADRLLNARHMAAQ